MKICTLPFVVISALLIAQGCTVPNSPWYADVDNDGYGDPNSVSLEVDPPPGNWVRQEGDCNDSDPLVNPGQSEILDDGIDNDCNPATPDSISTPTTWYRDIDLDGYGNDLDTLQSVSQPNGYAAAGGDCDDSNSSINPAATEVFDEVDNNCDGQIDEGTNPQFWYDDFDGDGYGDPNDFVYQPNSPNGHVADNTDCDDTRSDTYPGAPELADSRDNNCNGQIDDGVGTWYRDNDGDGYGDPVSTTQAAQQPIGYVANNLDCNDFFASVYPGAEEQYGNGLDDNCNGEQDEGFIVYFHDGDGDGFGDINDQLPATSQPTGYILNNSDCNDANPQTFPGALEVDDNQDNDCDGIIDEGIVTWYLDGDDDGYGDDATFVNTVVAPLNYIATGGDCNDSDNTVYPGAPELADNKDNNCNGLVDDGLDIWYADADSDGYGDPSESIQTANPPSGYVNNSQDCDDNDATVNPGVAEVYDNGKDDNCDGQVNEGYVLYYHDGDGDGFGDPNDVEAATVQPLNHTTDNGDCDDSFAGTYPGALEIADNQDNDCDGIVDEGIVIWYHDGDGDGYGDPNDPESAVNPPANHVANNADCNDNFASVNPDQVEVYGNGLDDNCDGQQNENFILYYHDGDGDGFGDASDQEAALSPPANHTTDFSDCDDTDGNTYPGALEIADNKDNDCDGNIDEGIKTWYHDADADGFGDPNDTDLAVNAPPGYVINGDDCNDSDASVNPSQSEIYGNNKDDNCDGEQDENFNIYYHDGDGDGYGDPVDTTAALALPVGYVANNTDCDDTDGDTYPGALELADGQDNDCDGNEDEGIVTWFHDGDNDGDGDPFDFIPAVIAPPGYVGNSYDCDDSDASVSSNQSEVYANGKDDNCDGNQDEGFVIYYLDGDGDGYGDPNNTFATTVTPPSVYVSDNSDCNDNSPAINPGVEEVFGNGVDDNCNGQQNESFGVYFADVDGDGYGDASDSVTGASQPAGYTTDDTDCDDADASVNPGETEVVNGVDDNCDGEIDEGALVWYRDVDSDGYGNNFSTTLGIGQPLGYVDNNSDCNDSNGNIYPGATEIYNAVDDDCDSLIDEGIAIYTFYFDGDGDGYGDVNFSQDAPSAPAGYVADNTDCDDGNSAINPGVIEINNNGVDDDCNPLTSDFADPPSCDYIEVLYQLDDSFYTITNTPDDLGNLPYQPIGPATMTIRYLDDGTGNPLDGGPANVVQYQVTADFLYYENCGSRCYAWIHTQLESVVPDDRYSVVNVVAPGSAEGVLSGDVITFTGGLRDHATTGALSCTSDGFVGGIICDQAPTGPVDRLEVVPLETITFSDTSPYVLSNPAAVERVATGGDADVDQTLVGDVVGVTNQFTAPCLD